MGRQMTKTVILVGAGQMGRSTLAILARSRPDARFLIVDRSAESLARAVAIDPARMSGRQCDVQREALDAAGADLVINLAGPFFLGSDRAARAALAAGAAYVDVCDDAEGTQTILDLDAEARRRGVPLITGAGNSPGISNWLACDILDRNPGVDGIKIVWVVRERDPGGLAVLRHMLHMAVAPCPIRRNGAMEQTKGFVPETSETFALPAPVGTVAAFDTAHPEPLTLARHRPDLALVQCKGSLFPGWANTAFSTLGRIGFGHSGLTVEMNGAEIEPIEVLWKLLWKRHNQAPARERPCFTQINVIGTRQGDPVVMRTITDDTDMSRGTGIGMAAAALALLEGGVAPGANGVEVIPAERGLGHVLRLSAAEGAFPGGIVETRF
jgi:lysine 6-dehydrogenase